MNPAEGGWPSQNLTFLSKMVSMKSKYVYMEKKYENHGARADNNSQKIP